MYMYINLFIHVGKSSQLLICILSENLQTAKELRHRLTYNDAIKETGCGDGVRSGKTTDLGGSAAQ